MASVNVYLNFDGSTREAFEFYSTVFNGKIAHMQSFAEVPGMEDLGEDEKGRIMHAAMSIGETVIMASDMLRSRGHSYVQGNHFNLTYNADSKEEADRVFGELAESGTIQMPIEKTFWNAYFGMVNDKFGIQWMINYEDAQQ